MKVVLILVVLVCAQQAMAEMNFDQSSGKSKFEILLDAYQTASKPAEYSDFPGEPVSNRKCVAATRKDPNQFAMTVVAVKDLILIDAVEEQNIPAQGPLFPAEHIPGKAAVTEKILVMSTSSYSINIMGQSELRLFKNSKTTTDFVITYLDRNPKLGYRVLIRSKGGFFPFAVQDASENEFSTFAVGYCY